MFAPVYMGRKWLLPMLFLMDQNAGLGNRLSARMLERWRASPVFLGPGALGRTWGTGPAFIGLCCETDFLFRSQRLHGIDLRDTESRQKARYPGNRKQQ